MRLTTDLLRTLPWLAALAAGANAIAQVPVAPLADCRRVGDDAARLRCYDALADRVAGTAAARPAMPIAAPPAAAAVASVAPAAPMPGPSAAAPPAAPARPVAAVPAAPAVAPAPAAPPIADAKKVVANVSRATITALQFKDDRSFVATLDNGQSWEQLRDQDRVGIAVGQVIRVERQPLGSYLMIGPNSRWNTRVKPRNAD